jgi:hypothetical protein
MKIDSQIEFIDQIHFNYTVDEIKNEPMLFNNDLTGAFYNSGEITKDFLCCLPFDWQESPLVIDSRVHMLMPGWYPCIPGWHHDDVPRVRSDGQPEYEAPTDRAEHILMLVNAHLAPTEFAIGEAEFDVPPIGNVIYEDWHKDVNKAIEHGLLTKQNTPDRTLIKFNDRTWHRGVAAVDNGWRFFIRASRYFDKDGNPIARRNKRTNEIRNQVQIYMSAENAGW